MFRNPIIRHVLVGYWFGDGDNNRAFYFKELSRVELETIALILSAVSKSFT
jgi:hypothetical protein